MIFPRKLMVGLIAATLVWGLNLSSASAQDTVSLPIYFVHLEDRNFRLEVNAEFVFEGEPHTPFQDAQKGPTKSEIVNLPLGKNSFSAFYQGNETVGAFEVDENTARLVVVPSTRFSQMGVAIIVYEELTD